jgi:crotonobetainyl-CoA:carnitine CoA-transferase CaiB-like acyl-CoA transferase
VRNVPVLGEHTRQILGSLGFSDQEVSALIEARVVRANG